MNYSNRNPYAIYNNVEGIVLINTSSDTIFTEFVNNIRIENSDTQTIQDAEQALGYVRKYCDNLDIISCPDLQVIQYFSKWRKQWVSVPIAELYDWPKYLKEYQRFHYQLREKPTT
jgi:hypothetical protein